MSTARRRNLTAEEKAECARLKAVYELRKTESKADGRKLSQADVGHECGWQSGQSAVNQYLNGKVALNVDALLKLAAVLRFEPEDVSPRLASEIRQISLAAEKVRRVKDEEDEEDFVLDGQGRYTPNLTKAKAAHALMHHATPRTKKLLERIETLALQGRLTEDDLALLDGIIDRFDKN